MLSVQLDELGQMYNPQMNWDKCITDIQIKTGNISTTLGSHMTFYSSILIRGLSLHRPTVVQTA